jgi:hypothetical protein
MDGYSFDIWVWASASVHISACSDMSGLPPLPPTLAGCAAAVADVFAILAFAKLTSFLIRKNRHPSPPERPFISG